MPARWFDVVCGPFWIEEEIDRIIFGRNELWPYTFIESEPKLWEFSFNSKLGFIFAKLGLFNSTNHAFNSGWKKDVPIGYSEYSFNRNSGSLFGLNMVSIWKPDKMIDWHSIDPALENEMDPIGWNRLNEKNHLVNFIATL